MTGKLGGSRLKSGVSADVADLCESYVMFGLRGGCGWQLV